MVPDLSHQTIYIQETSKILNIDTEILIKDLEKNKKKHKKSNLINEKQKENYLEPCQEENFLFKLLLNHGEKFVQINPNQKLQVAKMILQELQLDGISVSFPVFSKILLEYQNAIKKDESINKDYFINHQDIEISRITTYLISEKYKMDDWSIKNIKVKTEEDILFSLVKEGLIRFKLKRISDITKEILEKIPTMINEEEKKIELNRFSKLMDLSRNLHKQVGREC